jgi:hypothetical protein
MEATEMLKKFLNCQKKRCLNSTPSWVDTVIKFMPCVYPALEHHFEQRSRFTIFWFHATWQPEKLKKWIKLTPFAFYVQDTNRVLIGVNQQISPVIAVLKLLLLLLSSSSSSLSSSSILHCSNDILTNDQ